MSNSQIGFIRSREGDTNVLDGFKSDTNIEPEADFPERHRHFNRHQYSGPAQGRNPNPEIEIYADSYHGFVNDTQTESN